MVKHTQTIPWLSPTNCLNLFDHFVRLLLKGLTTFLAVFLEISLTRIGLRPNFKSRILSGHAKKDSNDDLLRFYSTLLMKKCFVKFANAF